MSRLARQQPELFDQWVTEAKQDYYAFQDWLQQRQKVQRMFDGNDVPRRPKTFHVNTKKNGI